MSNAIGDLIRKLRAEHDLTLKELAERVDLSYSSVSHKELGRTPVRGKPERERFARAFGMALDEFDAMWKGTRIEAIRGGDGIPIINSVPAGGVVDYEEYRVDSGQGYEHIDAIGFDGQLAYAVRVVGDSMEPTIIEGDYLIFSPASVPNRSARLEDGAVVFVRFRSDSDQPGCTLARWFDDGPEHVELRKDNPRRRPIRVRRNDIVEIGICVQRRTSRL